MTEKPLTGRTRKDLQLGALEIMAAWIEDDPWTLGIATLQRQLEEHGPAVIPDQIAGIALFCHALLIQLEEHTGQTPRQQLIDWATFVVNQPEDSD